MQIYKLLFSQMKEIDIIEQPNGCKSNFWLVTIRFNNEDPKEAFRKEHF